MFHPLRVGAVERLTDDAVALTFEVPPELREAFLHTPGQHIAVRRTGGGGEEIRRTYSICSPAGSDPAVRIGVRLLDGGEFSTYAVKELAVGDMVDVMPPTGRFVLRPRPGRFAAVVGGSGITPVLSMAATLLAREPGARFSLVRSDRSAATAMFLDEVADLKDRYPDRFQLAGVVSREQQQAGLPTGRLDRARLTSLLPALLPVADVDEWFLCGPLGLVAGAERALRDLGVERARIRQEIFHVDEAPAPAPPAASPSGSTLTATLGGRSGSWPVRDGEPLLATVLRARPDAPFACRGGVCGTCRALLVSGGVHMDRVFALEEEERAAGYVLTCQAHPETDTVEVDFDR